MLEKNRLVKNNNKSFGAIFSLPLMRPLHLSMTHNTMTMMFKTMMFSSTKEAISH